MTEHCESCHIGIPNLSDNEIEMQLKKLSGWIYYKEKKLIEKIFEFKNYYHAIAFVNAIAWMAHQEKHHPDLFVSYNKVVVQYQTHKTGGITKNDIICATLVENLQN